MPGRDATPGSGPGEIVTYDGADAVGRIRLEDGTVLRFGLGALDGFTPVVGTRVVVTASSPHPLGGLRATRVALAETEADHEAARLARDLEVGPGLGWNVGGPAPRIVAAPSPEAARARRAALAGRSGAVAAWLDSRASPPARLASLITAAGLGDHRAALEAAARPCVSVSAVAPGDGAARPGASRFGGTPDLPPDAPWPRRDGRPLAFLAQVALPDLEGLPAAAALPAAGHLAFFGDVDALDAGTPADGPDAVRVLRVAGPSAPAAAPAGTRSFDRCALALAADLSLPDPEGAQTLGLEGDDADRYIDLLWGELHADAPGEVWHQLLGHAETLQGELRPRADPGAWRLLLQLDTDVDGPGWRFGDAGRLFFLVPTDDLAAGRFDRVVARLQTT